MSTYKDRVRETSTTTGTSDFTLAGAVAGFYDFNASFGLNVGFDYCIEAVDANGVPTGANEVGKGYLSGTTTLVRSSVYRSSNADALVNFGAGSKIVFCTLAAPQVADRGMRLAMLMQLYLP